uniref:Uncharacterized protein n=1 Tax=viral metagenome TaxID=1070528 RepID=A0A6C0CGV2_9ZZZZ
MTELNTNDFIHSQMYIIGSQVYEDEEIIDCDGYASQSIYDSHPDEYIFEDPMDLLSITFQNKMNVRTIIVS